MSNNQKETKSAITLENSENINFKLGNQNNKLCFKKSNTLKINDNHDIKEEFSNDLLSKILDTINSNSLNVFYPDSNNEFKKKIDSLNLKFYLETEKFLSKKNKSEKCQTSLFIILFKQINIYIEEIERLNLIIIKRKYDPQKIMERTEEIIKKQNEFLIKEKLIKTLKESKSNMENKLLEAIINENKLKKEIQILKEENNNYKKKLNNNPNNSNNAIKDKDNKDNKNISNIIKSNFLYKLKHPIFNKFVKRPQNSINCMSSYGNKKFNGCDNCLTCRKRNNSDKRKFLLSSSLNKLDMKGSNIKGEEKKEKILFKDKFNVKNEFKNTKLTKSYMIKKKRIKIKLNDELDNILLPNNNTEKKKNSYLNKIQINDIKNSKSINLDFSGIKPNKTEYILNDINICENKKSEIYDDNNCDIYAFSIDTKKNTENKDLNNNFFLIKDKEMKDKERYYIMERIKKQI